METSREQSEKTTPPLPDAGKKKKDPEVLDKLLDKGVCDSMDASDPPVAAQPEVKPLKAKQPPPPRGENPDWLLNPPTDLEKPH